MCLVVFPKWAMVFYGFFWGVGLEFTKSFVWKLHDIVIKTDNIS